MTPFTRFALGFLPALLIIAALTVPLAKSDPAAGFACANWRAKAAMLRFDADLQGFNQTMHALGQPTVQGNPVTALDLALLDRDRPEGCTEKGLD